MATRLKLNGKTYRERELRADDYLAEMMLIQDELDVARPIADAGTADDPRTLALYERILALEEAMDHANDLYDYLQCPEDYLQPLRRPRRRLEIKAAGRTLERVVVFPFPSVRQSTDERGSPATRGQWHLYGYVNRFDPALFNGRAEIEGRMAAATLASVTAYDDGTHRLVLCGVDEFPFTSTQWRAACVYKIGRLNAEPSREIAWKITSTMRDAGWTVVRIATMSGIELIAKKDGQLLRAKADSDEAASLQMGTKVGIEQT